MSHFSLVSTSQYDIYNKSVLFISINVIPEHTKSKSPNH